jgi:hypothetical protein
MSGFEKILNALQRGVDQCVFQKARNHDFSQRFETVLRGTRPGSDAHLGAERGPRPLTDTPISARRRRQFDFYQLRLGHRSTRGQECDVPALLKLQDHRQRQEAFRMRFGSNYRRDLDLNFGNPDGSPLKPDSVSATISARFKRLKIPKPKGASLHLLRHTLASQMLDGGVPLPVVSARLGHSSIRTTAEIYSHAQHGQDDEATKRWEEYQQRNRGASSATKDVQ